MVEIKPFPAIRYDEKKVQGIDNVITQPYDKIPSDLQRDYYLKSEFNFCRLILPKEENRYEMAAKRVEAWLKAGALFKDKENSYYVYYQNFEVLGKKYTRKGFISAVELHPFKEKIVLPHEKTHEGPKIDRLNMLRATQKNLEPGFMLYSDPQGASIDIFDAISKEEPLYDVVDEYDVHNRVWKLDNKDDIAIVQELLKDQQIVIADGHHRYETAVSYRDEMREKHKDWTDEDAFNWRMTFMVPVEDTGLVVLPGHRLLLKHGVTDEHMDKIKEYFSVEKINISEADGYLEKNKGKISFVIYDGDEAHGILLERSELLDELLPEEYSKDYKGLDVVVLRDIIFEQIMGAEDLAIDETIAYERWANDAIKRVKEGRATVAFLVNATRPEQVLRVAKNGERMPEKSTDFYPKANSGFTVMDIEAGEKL